MSTNLHGPHYICEDAPLSLVCTHSLLLVLMTLHPPFVMSHPYGCTTHLSLYIPLLLPSPNSYTSHFACIYIMTFASSRPSYSLTISMDALCSPRYIPIPMGPLLPFCLWFVACSLYISPGPRYLPRSALFAYRPRHALNLSGVLIASFSQSRFRYFMTTPHDFPLLSLVLTLSRKFAVYLGLPKVYVLACLQIPFDFSLRWCQRVYTDTRQDVVCISFYNIDDVRGLCEPCCPCPCPSLPSA